MQIKFTEEYIGAIEKLNANRTFLQKKYGQPIHSSVNGKDVSIMTVPATDLDPAVFKGFNVGDILNSGTKAEVVAGTKDLTDVAAQCLIETNYAVQV